MNQAAIQLLMMSTNQAALLPWYVCWTKPRQERHAMRKLEEQGYEVYMPLLHQWTRRNGAWLKDQQAMFPRYCFVRCGRIGQSLGPIRSTPGVAGLICFCTKPATLQDNEIEAIRALADEQSRLERARLPFHTGDAVEISDGPLKGMNGIISVAAEVRVTVLLNMLGREKAVGFSANDLKLA